ncbi:hypothetical protein F2P81_016246 [Scophthalmus maximus]|uniref:Uncharacterized protein n=1 Tax=Scophthalmus maximus TaxID=52904 RepID=A0A6A4SKM5_SCOMX|nr:hypothetical protein F2P81_016246 [Scophthalmus maximus]
MKITKSAHSALRFSCGEIRHCHILKRGNLCCSRAAAVRLNFRFQVQRCSHVDPFEIVTAAEKLLPCTDNDEGRPREARQRLHAVSPFVFLHTRAKCVNYEYPDGALKSVSKFHCKTIDTSCNQLLPFWLCVERKETQNPRPLPLRLDSTPSSLSCQIPFIIAIHYQLDGCLLCSYSENKFHIYCCDISVEETASKSTAPGSCSTVTSFVRVRLPQFRREGQEHNIANVSRSAAVHTPHTVRQHGTAANHLHMSASMTGGLSMTQEDR